MAGGVQPLMMAGGNFTLYRWGRIEFQVYPLNVHEFDHTTQTDYARKDIMGSSPQREWTGEGDEEFTFRGRMFPYHVRLGRRAIPAIEAMDAERRRHRPNMLMRGGANEGYPLGWYVIDMLNRHNTLVGASGYGRVINFDVRFQRVDIPSVSEFTNSMLTSA